MMIVGEYQHDDNGEEQGIDKSRRVKRPYAGGSEKGQTGQKLHERILHGNGSFTETAFSPQNQPGNYRYIVVWLYRIPALRTARTRADYRFSQRNPVNANIQETSDNKPEQGIENQQKRINGHKVIIIDLMITNNPGARDWERGRPRLRKAPKA